jgi:hypothetical protein
MFRPTWLFMALRSFPLVLVLIHGLVTMPSVVEAKRPAYRDAISSGVSTPYSIAPTLTKGKGWYRRFGSGGTTDSSTTTTTPTTSSTSLSFTAMEGGTNPTRQTLTLTNLSGGTLTWSATENASWLNLSPPSGSTTNQTSSIAVNVDITGLAGNTYTGLITVAIQSPTATTQQIPVTLTVTPLSSAIGENPTSLTFVTTQGGANPTPQSINITNIGKGTLNWSASEAASWLSLTPTSGSTTGTNTMQASVNAAGLTANTYTTTITLTDPAASNGPQQVPVTLIITAPQSGSAQLSWNPSPSPDVVGYKVYIGTAPRQYTSPINVGTDTTHNVVGLLSGKTYYFAVSAYNTQVESAYSNEVQKSIP